MKKVSYLRDLIAEYRNQIAIEPSIAQDSALWSGCGGSLFPVPIRNVLNKYGAGWVKGYSDEDMEPYYEWKGRGITASLNEDTKEVSKIDFVFTVAEMIAGFRVGQPYSGGGNNNRNT
jgi:hypothetical protein